MIHVLTRSVFCLCLALTLAGCVHGPDGASLFDDPDAFISTGSLGAPTATKGIEQSDETQIRDAVGSADLKENPSLPRSWANGVTGSAGVVSNIVEMSYPDFVCRRFRTSRQSLHLNETYRGEICRKKTGSWVLVSFDKV